MSQEDYAIADQAGTPFLADLNNHLAAIVSNNSGATAPSTTYAYQWWADTTTGLLKIRNAANSAWITVGTLASAYLGLLPLTGGTLTGALTMSGAAIAPSSTKGIIGTTTNDSPDAGCVGEVISSVVPLGSAVSLTSGVDKNVTSVPLTAGHWDLIARVCHNTDASTSVTGLAGSVSQTSATHDKGFYRPSAAFVPGVSNISSAVPGKTIKIAAPATVYLVATGVFTAGTMTVHGEITATRVR